MEVQYRRYEEIVKEQQNAISRAEQQIAELEKTQEANQTAVFANMQAQANNNNALQRLEHELSGGERGKEKLEQKLSELRTQKEQQNQRHPVYSFTPFSVFGVINIVCHKLIS